MENNTALAFESAFSNPSGQLLQQQLPDIRQVEAFLSGNSGGYGVISEQLRQTGDGVFKSLFGDSTQISGFPAPDRLSNPVLDRYKPTSTPLAWYQTEIGKNVAGIREGLTAFDIYNLRDTPIVDLLTARPTDEKLLDPTTRITNKGRNVAVLFDRSGAPYVASYDLSGENADKTLAAIDELRESGQSVILLNDNEPLTANSAYYDSLLFKPTLDALYNGLLTVAGMTMGTAALASNYIGASESNHYFRRLAMQAESAKVPAPIDGYQGAVSLMAPVGEGLATTAGFMAAGFLGGAVGKYVFGPAARSLGLLLGQSGNTALNKISTALLNAESAGYTTYAGQLFATGMLGAGGLYNDLRSEGVDDVTSTAVSSLAALAYGALYARGSYIDTATRNFFGAASKQAIRDAITHEINGQALKPAAKTFLQRILRHIFTSEAVDEFIDEAGEQVIENMARIIAPKMQDMLHSKPLGVKDLDNRIDFYRPGLFEHVLESALLGATIGGIFDAMVKGGKAAYRYFAGIKNTQTDEVILPTLRKLILDDNVSEKHIRSVLNDMYDKKELHTIKELEAIQNNTYADIELFDVSELRKSLSIDKTTLKNLGHFDIFDDFLSRSKSDIKTLFEKYYDKPLPDDFRITAAEMRKLYLDQMIDQYLEVKKANQSLLRQVGHWTEYFFSRDRREYKFRLLQRRYSDALNELMQRLRVSEEEASGILRALHKDAEILTEKTDESRFKRNIIQLSKDEIFEALVQAQTQLQVIRSAEAKLKDGNATPEETAARQAEIKKAVGAYENALFAIAEPGNTVKNNMDRILDQYLLESEFGILHQAAAAKDRLLQSLQQQRAAASDPAKQAALDNAIKSIQAGLDADLRHLKVAEHNYVTHLAATRLRQFGNIFFQQERLLFEKEIHDLLSIKPVLSGLPNEDITFSQDLEKYKTQLYALVDRQAELNKAYNTGNITGFFDYLTQGQYEQLFGNLSDQINTLKSRLQQITLTPEEESLLRQGIGAMRVKNPFEMVSHPKHGLDTETKNASVLQQQLFQAAEKARDILSSSTAIPDADLADILQSLFIVLQEVMDSGRWGLLSNAVAFSRDVLVATGIHIAREKQQQSDVDIWQAYQNTVNAFRRLNGLLHESLPDITMPGIASEKSEINPDYVTWLKQKQQRDQQIAAWDQQYGQAAAQAAAQPVSASSPVVETGRPTVQQASNNQFDIVDTGNNLLFYHDAEYAKNLLTVQPLVTADYIWQLDHDLIQDPLTGNYLDTSSLPNTVTPRGKVHRVEFKERETLINGLLSTAALIEKDGMYENVGKEDYLPLHLRPESFIPPEVPHPSLLNNISQPPAVKIEPLIAFIKGMEDAGFHTLSSRSPAVNGKRFAAVADGVSNSVLPASYARFLVESFPAYNPEDDFGTFVEEITHIYREEKLQRLPYSLKTEGINSGIQQPISYSDLKQQGPNSLGNCVFSGVIIDEHNATFEVRVIGDSPLILIRNGKAYLFNKPQYNNTPDQFNAYYPDQQNRFKKDGVVFNDKHLLPGLSDNKLEKGDIFIIASDKIGEFLYYEDEKNTKPLSADKIQERLDLLVQAYQQGPDALNRLLESLQDRIKIQSFNAANKTAYKPLASDDFTLISFQISDIDAGKVTSVPPIDPTQLPPDLRPAPAIPADRRLYSTTGFKQRQAGSGAGTVAAAGIPPRPAEIDPATAPPKEIKVVTRGGDAVINDFYLKQALDAYTLNIKARFDNISYTLQLIQNHLETPYEWFKQAKQAYEKALQQNASGLASARQAYIDAAKSVYISYAELYQKIESQSSQADIHFLDDFLAYHDADNNLKEKKAAFADPRFEPALDTLLRSAFNSNPAVMKEIETAYQSLIRGFTPTSDLSDVDITVSNPASDTITFTSSDKKGNGVEITVKEATSPPKEALAFVKGQHPFSTAFPEYPDRIFSNIGSELTVTVTENGIKNTYAVHNPDVPAFLINRLLTTSVSLFAPDYARGFTHNPDIREKVYNYKEVLHRLTEAGDIEGYVQYVNELIDLHYTLNHEKNIFFQSDPGVLTPEFLSKAYAADLDRAVREAKPAYVQLLNAFIGHVLYQSLLRYDKLRENSIASLVADKKQAVDRARVLLEKTKRIAPYLVNPPKPALLEQLEGLLAVNHTDLNRMYTNALIVLEYLDRLFASGIAFNANVIQTDADTLSSLSQGFIEAVIDNNLIPQAFPFFRSLNLALHPGLGKIIKDGQLTAGNAVITLDQFLQAVKEIQNRDFIAGSEKAITPDSIAYVRLVLSVLYNDNKEDLFILNKQANQALFDAAAVLLENPKSKAEYTEAVNKLTREGIVASASKRQALAEFADRLRDFTAAGKANACLSTDLLFTALKLRQMLSGKEKPSVDGFLEVFKALSGFLLKFPASDPVLTALTEPFPLLAAFSDMVFIDNHLYRPDATTNKSYLKALADFVASNQDSLYTTFEQESTFIRVHSFLADKNPRRTLLGDAIVLNAAAGTGKTGIIAVKSIEKYFKQHHISMDKLAVFSFQPVITDTIVASLQDANIAPQAVKNLDVLEKVLASQVDYLIADEVFMASLSPRPEDPVLKNVSLYRLMQAVFRANITRAQNKKPPVKVIALGDMHQYNYDFYFDGSFTMRDSFNMAYANGMYDWNSAPAMTFSHRSGIVTVTDFYELFKSKATVTQATADKENKSYFYNRDLTYGVKSTQWKGSSAAEYESEILAVADAIIADYKDAKIREVMEKGKKTDRRFAVFIEGYRKKDLKPEIERIKQLISGRMEASNLSAEDKKALQQAFVTEMELQGTSVNRLYYIKSPFEAKSDMYFVGTESAYMVLSRAVDFIHIFSNVRFNTKPTENTLKPYYMSSQRIGMYNSKKLELIDQAVKESLLILCP